MTWKRLKILELCPLLHLYYSQHSHSSLALLPVESASTYSKAQHYSSLGRHMSASTLSNAAATFSIPHLSPSGRPTRATGAETRENLDHMQRARKEQVSKQPTRRIIAQPAPLGLWDQFPAARTVQQMMDTMDEPLLRSSQGGVRSGYRRGRTPWEIKEEDNEYRMRFDIPGMTKRDLDVKVLVEEKMLVVNAEKEPKKGEVEEEEWTYGRYNFTIALPENLVMENIKAEVKDGVLYVTLPRAHSSTKILEIDVQ